MNTNYSPLDKSNIRTLLIGNIFEGSDKELEKSLESLIQRHSNLCTENVTSFMYKGNVFYTKDWVPSGGRIRLLDRSLYEVGDKYIKEANELKSQKQTVSGFLSVLLTKSNTPAQLWAYCPPCIRGAIEHPSMPVDIPEEEINSFWEANKETIDIIKENLVLNLLL